MRRRSTPRALLVALGLAVVVAACAPTEEAAPSTTRLTETTIPAPPLTTVAPTTTTAVPEDVGPVAVPVRHPVTARSIYFVMTDRFANGDAANDTGGMEGSPLVHGYLPEDIGYYHGGDLAGLTARLPYLAELGMTAIWITPPFTNRVVQGDGTIEGSSAGYHGYWQVDWTRIDPHLGTEEEMQAFVAAAHEAGLDVFFDAVLNHTGDVITYEEGVFSYQSKAVAPYVDAAGVEFDDAEFATEDDFPELAAAGSFPYTPTFATPEDATLKRPDWLNDVTLYHNRGNSSFTGENSLYGDFFGLDDLFTEHPAVVDGMTDLYADIIRRYGIDGFRIDTVKHVNDEFWAQWSPEMLTVAQESGIDDFFMFGEVFSEDPILASNYTTNLGIPGSLDFILNGALERYVARGVDAATMADAFDADDWYLDADSNASMLVTFFGNHDIGRMGYLIGVANSGSSQDLLVRRMQLGFDLLFLSRGVPVVYYGDEQGFAGRGGDQEARQTMFPAVAAEYATQNTLGTDATPGDDNFDPGHPLFGWVAGLNALRAEHGALVTGAQVVHEPDGAILAFSRIDRTERIEYLVVANNTAAGVKTEVAALSGDTTFTQLRSDDPLVVTSAPDGTVSLEVPGLTALVLRAETPLAVPEAAPTIALIRPTAGTEIPTFRYRLEAELGDRRYAEVTFAVSVDGGEPQVLGTDDAPPYRVYWNNAAVPAGSTVEIIATVEDGSGRWRAATTTVTVGERR